MDYRLREVRLGPLPILNHFLDRLGLEALLGEFVPTLDRRVRVPYATSLGVLLRSIVVEREPLYRLEETAREFAPEAFGLTSRTQAALRDDAVGRALDRLFDADRGSLLTAVVVAAARKFQVSFDEIHNDSTTIRLTGQYRAARGRRIRGLRAPFITYGFSKDHRPDLKQLLFILTTSADGGLPVQFRCADGNASDSKTHIETWEAIRTIAGRSDFLYVADCKLCSGENLDHIDRNRGRFVTVLPRSRAEDAQFRKWIQTNTPVWETVWDRPHPREEWGPRDVWRAWRSPLPSREGWPVIWVSSALLALHQEETRQEHLARAVQELEDLRGRLSRPRPRLRSSHEVLRRIERILGRLHVGRYLRVRVTAAEEHRFRQERPGRPGKDTRFRRLTRRRLGIEWTLDEEALAYDRRSDGMYPLLTNDRSLTPADALASHKGQPLIEKRFAQTKSVYEIAPVLLKNEGRIEALFFVYFLALLLQALIEREVRRAMARAGIRELPLYPEERECRRPTTEQVLRLFALAHRSELRLGRHVLQVFEPKLTPLQEQLLDLLGVPRRTYRARA